MTRQRTAKVRAQPRHARAAQDVGQLLVIGFDGTESSPQLTSLLTRIEPAGVILFARNIVSPQQTFQLVKDCQGCVEAPLFTCVDMEGGRVDRLRNAIGPSPSAVDVYATQDRRLFRKHGKVIGDLCRAAGFNTDLAPVMDLAFEGSKEVMRTRSVSADPGEAVVYAREFLAGLRSAGVLGCGKHFPGLGEANLDTHHELPSVEKSFKKLWAEDIQPYCKMRRDLSMVLVGHAAYPSITGDQTPASLSKKFITDILRKKVGFRGLVLSDDLEMGGVLAAAPIGEATVQFIRAGGDLALVCHKEEYVLAAYEALVRETERDPKFAKRVAESAKHIAAFKKKSRELKRRTGPPTTERVQKLTRMLWEFGEQVRLEALTQGEPA